MGFFVFLKSTGGVAMNSRAHDRRRWVVIGALFVLAFSTRTDGQSRAPGVGMEWPQWGGPNRNFVSDSKGLPSTWPAAGPKKLWSRSLGEGHSSIVVDGKRLYTMYRPLGLMSMIRRSQEEVIVAIDAGAGDTIWEHKYPSPTEGLDFGHGSGPHSTPLLMGNRLYATSSRKELFALDKNTGRRFWYHDFIKEYNAPRAGRGYTCSPLAYKNNIIVTVGGSGQSVMAFHQQTGAVVWKNQSFDPSPASPIIINVDGQDQLVLFAAAEVAGLDPNNGALLWKHPHKTDYGLNISTPVWGPDNLLFVTSAYGSGARLLRLSQRAGKTTVEEVWFQNRMRVHHGTVIRLGDFAVGSSGDFGPCPMAAIDFKTGKILWQDRSFARSTLVHADGKLIIMDEDGTLGLATVTREGMRVLARAEILENQSWTVPTLAGTRLYVRDRKTMAAYDLGG